ncbi:MAG: amidohydrolase [bacterium P3]|nr:MAG: amidohydrolase [bacterium P3]KWW41969.1 MAG: amidohydrolase [bacterium F083]
MNASVRQDLHCHPGVSGDEHYAHDLIVSRLRALHPDALHTHVGGYGVVAYFGVAPGLPAVALRADIDALPIGHRCGHDGHTATLLRVAELLGTRRQERGVLLVFQPEEETGTGARKVLDSGVLDTYDIRAFLAVHNIPGYPLHEVLLSEGTFAAASSGVVYCLHGRPTHASTPEMGVNPGLAVAEIVQRMQRLTDVDPTRPAGFRQATLVGIRLGDRTFGTSAGDAEVMFTLRAFTNAAMRVLFDAAHRMVADVAAGYRLSVTYERVEPFSATENSPQVVGRLRALAESEGCHCTMLQRPFRWSEDFADYLMRYPGALLGIGAGEDHVELHHPDYDFPDALIEPTARLLAAFAENLAIV